MDLRQLFKGTFLLLAALMLSNTLIAQCVTFKESPKEEDGMIAHSLYRDAVKAKDFPGAYDNWKTAYEIACLLYTSPSPRDQRGSRMPSSA